jgi:hypothetical protein
MGDILPFPSRSNDSAKYDPRCKIQNSPSRANEMQILKSAHFRITKALLFSLASLETALRVLERTVDTVSMGDCRERLLRQQTAFVVMICQAQSMLAEYEPSLAGEIRAYEAAARSEVQNSAPEQE